MGFWRRTAVYWGLAEAEQREEFSAPETVNEVISAAQAQAAPSGPSAYSAPVTREFALGVPAVLRGRNIICAISTLPLRHYKVEANQVVRSTFLEQIDPHVPNIVTLAQTVEDLLFDAVSWWRITAFGADKFPTSARHLEPSRVKLDPPAGKAAQSLPSGVDVRSVVWVDGKPVPKASMIRFDSPNPPLLVAGCRAIRRAALLDTTAALYAENPRPLEYFGPAEDADPDEAEVIEFLTSWRTARQTRSTAYKPGAFERHEAGSTSPADLQLAQLQARASLDIANAIGLDPEELGVSTTSRTYANITDRRRDRINDTLSPYMLAITSRLSMNDVTKRGYAAQFDLDDYLRADPKTRAEVAAIYIAQGVVAPAEVREDEGLPPREIEPPAAPAPPAPVEEPDQPAAAAASRRDVIPMHRKPSAQAFAAADAQPMMGLQFSFDDPDVEFAASAERRTISGALIPFGPVGENNAGRWRFEPGSVTWNRSAVSRVKLNRDHDRKALLGAATTLRASTSAVLAAFKVGRSGAGTEALQDAEDGILDGFSAEVDIHEWVPDPADPSVNLVKRAVITGAALTGIPAFDDARVTKVAASNTTMKESTAMSDTLAATGAAAAAPAAQIEPAPAPTVPAQFAAPAVEQVPAVRHLTLDEVREVIRAELAAVREQAEEQRAFVDPDHRADAVTLSVREPLPYRFDRRGNLVDAEHSFSSDIVAMSRAGDDAGETTDAGKRVMSMLREQFATATTDVNELNPTINRPDMYVDQQDYRTPLWDLVNKGGLPNGVQPFTFPKFSSSSGLIGDHTEGSEPTAGTFVTTSQTVNPSALSGLAEINREVWDMGGSPAASGLIWAQMVRGWREGLESATATFLNTLTAATDIALTTAAADDDLAGEWDAAVADLQFVRGYDFSACALEKVLYKKFVAAVDSGGRKLFPILAPSNANGTASPRFRQLDLSGVIGVPSWALASTGGASNNSWLFDPMYVHGWADPPQRLDFQVRVKSVDIGIWSYKAFANSDIAAVRQITYDGVA